MSSVAVWLFCNKMHQIVEILHSGLASHLHLLELVLYFACIEFYKRLHNFLFRNLGILQHGSKLISSHYPPRVLF